MSLTAETPASQQARTGENRCSVEHLTKYFPITSGIILQHDGRPRSRGRGCEFLRSMPGETVGLVGESGCGKSTTARRLVKTPRSHIGHDHLRGKRHLEYEPAGAAASPARHADHLPGPLCLIESSTDDRADRRGAVPDPQDRGRHEEEGPGVDGENRPQPGALQPLSARVLRRSASAHRRGSSARPSGRSSSCATSRCRPSMSRSRRRSSICWRTSRTSTT